MNLRNQIISQNILPVILGPTASGKTALSLEIAQKIDCEIISADSRQVYRYLDIGTAKPTAHELQQAKHHFIDIFDPNEYYSAGKFGNKAKQTVNEVYENGRIPLVVGGSGLYIKALCEGLFNENSKPDSEIISEIDERIRLNGIDELYEELCIIDPISARLYLDKNPRRIARSLAYYYETGMPLSLAQQQFKAENTFRPIYFEIEMPREQLYERINLRSQQMWDGGLVDETQKVLDRGYAKTLNSLNTVGYKETIEYLEGKTSAERTLELIKQNTRHYAKRQLTWFRANRSINKLSGDTEKMSMKMINEIQNCIKL